MAEKLNDVRTNDLNVCFEMALFMVLQDRAKH